MQPTRRSTIFLMELIMAILIFSLAATVCVQVFVKSHIIEKDSNQLSNAVFASVSVAEIIRSSDDYDSVLFTQYPFMLRSNDTYSIFYDNNWTVTYESNAKYCLKISFSKVDGMIDAIIRCNNLDSSSTIYELKIKKYQP